MNRGSADRHGSPERARPASMRPRFMNRGSSPRRSAAGSRASGFNEAPIHESGKCKKITWPGQATPASMRPRFMNRGSQGQEDWLGSSAWLQ